MIEEKQLGWFKEFLFSHNLSEADRNQVNEMMITIRKLWHVAKAARSSPYPRSPRLSEALAAIDKPRPPKLLRIV